MQILILVCYCMCVFKKHVSAIDIWHSYQFGSGAGNREELIVKNVTADPNFHWGENVLRWKSLQVEDRNYAVGIRPEGLTILSFTKNFEVTSKNFDINTRISDITIFQRWNQDLKFADVIVIVATEDLHLNWYRLDEQLNLIRIWKWVVLSPVIYLKAFRIFEKNALLLINNKTTNHTTTADLYEFELHRKGPNIWLLQTIPLDCPANSSALNTNAMDIYLTIPQGRIETVLIFKYVQNRFVPYYNLTNIKGIQHVNSFNSGSKSFLAIGGANAGIYALSNAGGPPIRQEIADHNLEEIHYWFPVPVKTYRDDVVLIAQRNLDHQTHTTIRLEILLYDGSKFVVHDEMPCYYHGEIEHGLDCITDEEMDQGVMGSAVISTENTLSVLVPRKDLSSALFSMNTEMRPTHSRINLQVNQLLEMRDKIEKMLNRQNEKLAFIHERIRNRLKTDGENVITAPWKIDTLAVPTMTVKNPINWIQPDTEAAAPEKLDFQSLVKKVSNASRQLEMIEENLGQPATSKKLTVLNELHISGELEVRGVADIKNMFLQNINNEPVVDTLEDIVRIDRIIRPLQHKTVENLKCENISFSSINGIDADFLAFKTDKLTIDGDVVFEKPVHISEHVTLSNGGTVNSKVLPEEVIEVNRAYDISISFQSLEVKDSLKVDTINNEPFMPGHISHTKSLKFQNITIPRNITVETVNGVDFNDFLSRICLRELDCHIPGDLTINGNMYVRKGGLVLNLNDIPFPNGFLLTANRSDLGGNYKAVTGKKAFLNGLEAAEAVVKHGIDEIHTMGHVDLTSNQLNLGNFTFHDIEVTESFEVDNEVYGNFIDNILPNPLITETNNITRNVNFQQLEVSGNIIVEDSFNGSSLESLLGNIVYKDEDNVVINSVKQFPKGLTIQNGLQISSKTINKTPMDLFVTKDTKQDIIARTLNGDVIFENLNIQGLYDGVNITEVDQESVKLSGQQFITSDLEFLAPDLFVNQLEIKKLNGQVSEDLLDGSNITFNGNIDFAHIVSSVVIANGDLNGEIENFDIRDIANRALSKTKDQNITGNFMIVNSTVNSAEIDFMHDDIQQLNDPKKILSYLENGDLLIKEIFVNGSLSVDYINGRNFNEVIANAMTVEDLQDYGANITFLDDVWVDSLQVVNLNGLNFNEFVDNIVFKSDSDLVMGGEKIFLNGLQVNGDIATNALNGVPLEELVVPSNIFDKPVIIRGNLIVNGEANVQYLNGIQIDTLQVFQALDPTTYLIRGDVWFERLAFVEKLYVDGYGNGVNVNDLLQSMVYKNSPDILLETTTFEQQVQFESTLDISNNVNGLNFGQFLSEMVLTTGDTDITSVMFFADPVIVETELQVDTYLDAENVVGVDFREWKNNAVYVNGDRITGDITLAKAVFLNNINVETLNGIDVLTYIPLRTDQIIPVTLIFEELHVESDVSVGKTVNGLILEAEYYNTLMKGIPQEVHSQIVFSENVIIEGNLQIARSLNNIDVSTIVTTNLNQNLTANYVFHEAAIHNADLFCNGFVNNVNTTIWNENVLLKEADRVQNVTGEWNVRELTCVGDVTSNGLVGELKLRNVYNDVAEQMASNKEITAYLQDKYQTNCKEVQNLLKASKEQTYLFRYFDFLQTLLDAENDIQNVHSFKYRGQDYLLVNVVDNCNALMYRWSGDLFILIGEVPTGMVEQFINVNNPDGNLFLISRSNPYDDDAECDFTGTNIWMFEDDMLMHVRNILPAEILQDSLKPNTFYTFGQRLVLEYTMCSGEILFRIVRRWFLQGDNMAFVPRGASTGLCLRDGTRLMKLFPAEDPFGIQTDYFNQIDNHNLDVIEDGNYIVEYNQYFPAVGKGELSIIPVKNSFGSKNLVAVASHEETSVKGPLDYIKIYENIIDGTLFHKVPANNPSSLVTMSFGNGETLLIFLEDEKALSIYEYKGIEGFKRRNSVRLQASKIQPISLSMRQSQSEMSVLVVINRNRVSLLKAVMAGSPVNIDSVECHLPPV